MVYLVEWVSGHNHPQPQGHPRTFYGTPGDPRGPQGDATTEVDNSKAVGSFRMLGGSGVAVLNGAVKEDAW